MVEARPGIAFIDFDNELQSGVALSGLQVRAHACVWDLKYFTLLTAA